MVEATKMAENAVEIAGGAGADIIDINLIEEYNDYGAFQVNN